MAYVVNITLRAGRDLVHLYDEINAADSRTARKWYQGLKKSTLSLEKWPNRCPATPESHALRHLLYGRKPYVYRVIYRVQPKQQQVVILHIRHGARSEFKTSDLA